MERTLRNCVSNHWYPEEENKSAWYQDDMAFCFFVHSYYEEELLVPQHFVQSPKFRCSWLFDGAIFDKIFHIYWFFHEENESE